jgi:hypothetical protein
MGITDDRSRRKLPFFVLLAVIVSYLAVLLVANAISTISLHQLDYGRFPDITTIVRVLFIPVGLSVVFCIGVIHGLGWWRPVLAQDPPVQRWVLLIPTVIVLAILIGTDYGALADRKASFVISLLVGSLLIGIGEELMFRGIVVAALRLKGRKETTVALWSSLLFGAAHTMNWFFDGGGHVMQVISTIFMGWFLYLTRRATRGLLVPILLHALWDFGLFSGNFGKSVYPGALAFIAAQVLLVPFVIFRRRRVEVPATA